MVSNVQKLRGLSVYLAGPMRGHDEFNFPAFFRAAKVLRANNIKVWSPAENDDANGFAFEGVKAEDTYKLSGSASEYMATDLPEVCLSDAVVVLPEWESSELGQLEVHVARTL